MQILKKSIQLAALVAALAVPLVNAQVQSLLPTPTQTEGPFYPGAEIFKNANSNMANLGKTDRWTGEPREASGEKLMISGLVLDTNGNLIEEAEVQIWQTDGLHGRYLVEQSDKPLDPNFKYVGKSISDSGGAWGISTVRPIEYEADKDWTRPSHIHVKVFVKGEPRLTTQIYFSDEMELIKKDKIIQQLPPEQQKLLIVELASGFRFNEKLGTFDIVLK